MQVVRIDRPHGKERPELPRKSVNYHRELAEKGWRKGLKPLTVQQPEGPSFTVRRSSAHNLRRPDAGSSAHYGLLPCAGAEQAGRVRRLNCSAVMHLRWGF